MSTPLLYQLEDQFIRPISTAQDEFPQPGASNATLKPEASDAGGHNRPKSHKEKVLANFGEGGGAGSPVDITIPRCDDVLISKQRPPPTPPPPSPSRRAISTSVLKFFWEASKGENSPVCVFRCLAIGFKPICGPRH